MRNFPLSEVGSSPVSSLWDASQFLEEMNISEATREIIRRSWPWYRLELGGGVMTITSDMLSERSDDELLGLAGMTLDILADIRVACTGDPGAALNIYSRAAGASQDEVEAFNPVRDENQYDQDGTPVGATPIQIVKDSVPVEVKRGPGRPRKASAAVMEPISAPTGPWHCSSCGHDNLEGSAVCLNCALGR